MAEQANISLTIGADGAQAETALLKAEAAERKLEAAVKSGNRTAKIRANTLGELEQGLAKLEAREKQYATAQQKRAAASLAAQKSRALLAEMEAKASRERRVSQGWEVAAAKAQMDADKRNHERVVARVTELKRLHDEQRGSFRRGAAAAVQWGTSLIGIGTAAAAAAAAVRGLAAAHEYQMDVARRSDTAAAGLKEFIALQAPGAAGKQHVQAAIMRGAAAGVSAADVGAMAQPIQSVVDANGDGRLDEGERAKFDEDFAAALKLRQLGITPEDAQTVITSNRARGIGGTEAANKLIAASDVSAAGPADFARSASAMGQFKDSDTALAVATALTQEEKNFEQIPTLVRGAAKVLGEANDQSDFSKKFGLAGLSEADKIARLRELGKTRGTGATEEERIASFSRTMRNEGLDEESARALGILIRQGPNVAQTRERLGSVDPGLADAKVAGLLADPLTGSQMRAEQAAASATADKLYGVDSAKARDRRAAALARGAELQRFGGGMAVDPETGEERAFYDPRTWFGRGRAMLNGMPGTGLNRGGTNQDPSLTGAEKLEAQLAELNKALQENTEATKANSTSAAAAKAGGAASNAEERY